MCGGYQAERYDLQGRRQALNQNSEAYIRAIHALLDQIEESIHELEQWLVRLKKIVKVVNWINRLFAAIAVGIWLFRLLNYLGLP